MKDRELKDELIWSFIEGSLSENQKHQFEEELSTDADLKMRYDEINSLNSFAKKSILSSPSLQFTEHVMHKIQQVNLRPKRSHWLIFLGVFITILISGSYLSEYNTALIIDMSEIKLPTSILFLQNSEFTINQSLPLDSITKVLLYVMSFLSLIFFDKAILKPYFKNRKMSN